MASRIVVTQYMSLDGVIEDPVARVSRVGCAQCRFSKPRDPFLTMFQNLSPLWSEVSQNLSPLRGEFFKTFPPFRLTAR
jgi:hypothetical protein